MAFTKIPSLRQILSDQISGIVSHFPRLPEVSGVLFSGSCSQGVATYRSDIDLLVVLKAGPLTYSRVQEIRDQIEDHFERIGQSKLLATPLPVQLTVVLLEVYQTSEPAMKYALKKAKILIDTDGELKRKSA